MKNKLTSLLIFACWSLIFVGIWLGNGTFFSSEAATILTTSSTDTIGTFRTNVNTSLTNLNTAIVANSIGGSDTQIQYNNGGVFAGDSNLVWSSSTKTFTITGGGFNVGTSTATGVITGITPTLSAHLATKEYVDTSINTEADYFLSSSTSDIGTHFDLTSLASTDAENTITSSSISSGDDQFLFSYLTTTTIPNSLEAGVYNGHLHLNKSGGGQTMKIYWTLSSFTSSSVETVRMTSEISDELGTNSLATTLHASIDLDIELNTDDRLLFRIY
ncbi:MAG TPA: hypothetical protein ENI23_11785, partial [bacterium]|nr:hypothetical protein [bacterium]